MSNGHQYGGGGNVQWLPKIYYGLDIQRGNFGLGAFLLNTEPNRGCNCWESPIQGSTGILVRLTYNFNL